MIENIQNNQNEFRNLQQSNNAKLSNSIAFNANTKNEVENKTTAGVQKKEVSKTGECKTCSERRYQDGSDDAGVSFKTPTRIAPSQVASAVMSHENEHYTREAQQAKVENKEVLMNSVRLTSAICPDCGKIYVSGGETTTVTRTRPSESPSPVKEVQSDGLKLDIGL